MQKLYLIFCLKVLCDSKVEPQIFNLTFGVVQIRTVISLGALSSTDPDPRKVVQFYATIGAVCAEYSSFQLSELVGKVPLRAFGGNKVEVRQCFLT